MDSNFSFAMRRGSVPQQLTSVAARYRSERQGAPKPQWCALGEGTQAAAQREPGHSLNETAGETPHAARVEAVMWLADEPLSLRRIAKLANLEGVAEARRLIEALRQQHLARRSAFEIVEVAGGFQLLTRTVFSHWISKLAGHAGLPTLRGPSLETLAIVAHLQPVLRAEVEAIRGVGCGELLRQLLESDLLRIVGRAEELGRPLLYGTTKRFLQVFGLRNLEELPQPAGGVIEMRPTKDNATDAETSAA